MPVRTIRGDFLNADGSPTTGAAVRAILAGFFAVDGDTMATPVVDVRATTDGAGYVELDVVVPETGTARYAIETPKGRFSVNLADGEPITFAALFAAISAGAIPQDAITTALDAHTGDADPHPQYLTVDEGDARYQPAGGEAIDHGLLAGLADDDHPQYLTQTRGDARYPVLADLATEASARAAADGALDTRVGALETAPPAHSHPNATTSAAGFLSAADKTKLDGVAAGATQNATNVELRDRGTHTGEQAISTVSGLQTALDDKASAAALASEATARADADDALDTRVAALEAGAGEGGVTDHGLLTGLGDDDHPQYLNQTRGDARYYTETESDALLVNKASTAALASEASAREAADTALGDRVTALEVEPPGHGHDIDDVTGLQTALDGKIGTADSRLSDSRTPSGGAGGVLSGTYPNPGFAVDMATQGELDGHAAATSGAHGITSAGAALTTAANAAAQRSALGLGTAAQSATGDFVSATTTRAANLVLAGPGSGAAATPSFRQLVAADLPAATTSAQGAVELATDGETAAGVAVQGNDSRLSNSRAPSGAAGGVLSGTYPNPGFAADMATQAELDGHTGATTAHGVDLTTVYRSGGADVALADGGTGASTAADARTNLGLGTAATANTGSASGNVPAFGADLALPLPTGSSPTTPGSGAKLYPLTIAGRPVLHILGPDGVARPLADPFWNGSRMFWGVQGTSPTVLGSSSSPFGNTGAASRPALDASAWPLSARFRLRMPSNTTASSSGGWRSNAAVCWRGDAAGRGGWWHVVEFGMGELPASVSNAFVGYSATTGSISSGTQPSALLSSIGMGFERTDPYWSIFHNDGSGTATKISLGASFPVDTSSLYRFTHYVEPNSGNAHYYVENRGTGAVASGTITTDLPPSGTFLGAQYYCSMNSGTTAVAIDVAYAEAWHGL